MNDKYLNENDQFFYDEHNHKKGSFLKQDSELFNDEDNIPGSSVHVKRTSHPKEDWQILINNKEALIIRGTRFTSKEREFLRSANGMLFIINGTKKGWKTVSEFKRQLQEIL